MPPTLHLPRPPTWRKPLPPPETEDPAVDEVPWDSLAHHYEKMKELLDEPQRDRDTMDTSSSCSSEAGGSPRNHEISVPLSMVEPDMPDVQTKDTLDLRYIGEGLIDLSGLDALDRLSEISIVSEVDVDAVHAMPPKAVIEEDEPENHQSPFNQAAPAKPSSAPASKLPVRAPPPPPPQRTSINKTRSKLLDFLAIETNDHYLDNVYQDETRDEPELQQGEADVSPQRADQLCHRQENAANDKLYEFLNKVEVESITSDRDSDCSVETSSVASTNATSSSRWRRRQEVTKLYEDITKTPERPRFVLFNPEDIKQDVHGPSVQQTPSSTNSLQEVNSLTKSSARMIELRQKHDSIREMCEANKLSEVAMAKISTLLSSISDVVQQDLSCDNNSPYDMRRRLSYTDAPETAITAKVSWAKTSKEREIEERLNLSSQRLSLIGEPLPSPLARVASRLHSREPPLKVSPTVGDSMRGFECAQNLLEVLSTFHRLLVDCGLGASKSHDPWAVYRHIKAGVHKKISFRQKQLFKLLDKKMSSDVYRKKPSAGQRVCIIGAGPIGLRAAVEMALLGAEVVVIEKRKHFSRENILHLWPWVVQDLTSLGAKVFFPAFCHTTAYYHVGTRQLQCILLKVALLLGVTMYPATTYEGIARPDSLAHDRRPYYSVMTEPQIPWMEFTAVMGAAGTQDRFSQDVGLQRFVFARKEAIGLICYFPNRGTMDEKRVGEFSWTAQFKKDMFAKMRTLGLDLENIVYYRGEVHYIVMTPKRHNLLEEGVLRTNYVDLNKLLADDNINVGRLHDYVTTAIRFFKIPQKAPFARVRLFDFSTRTRSDKAASVLASNGKKLYAGLIGDALLEPFWPEGLGTCRGFLSALDSAWMVSQIGKHSDEQLLADRELGYRIIQHISGVSRGDLQKNVRKYNCDPRSRYTVKYPAPVH